MNSLKKYLPLALMLGFLAIAISAYIQSKPSHKNARVYTTVKQYSPYYTDQRFGGIQIMSKEDANFKEKPDNMALFKRLDELEKAWGQKHLKLENNTLIILDNNGTQQATLPLNTQEEINFTHHFYGI
ncbi:MAG: hypothetical protein B6D54_00170 [Epsilonproteobacteria bacterium 4484_65]|nr:MAG: hypothetical protein B6D54_00170 [Epsilonproteobacteria bacterium 4484_65]